MDTNQSNNFGAIGKFIGNEELNKDIVNFNLVEFPLPSHNLPPIPITRNGKKGYKPGDAVESDLSIVARVLVDEDLKIYLTLLEMMHSSAGKGSGEELLTIQKMNNQNRLVAVAKYNKAWITNIGEILYDTQGTDTFQYVLVTVSYLTFSIAPN